MQNENLVQISFFNQLMLVHPRKKQNERSEASVQVSEYFVNAEGKCRIYSHYVRDWDGASVASFLCSIFKGTGDKVNLSDLLGTVEKTSGASNKTKKQLRNLQSSKETLELPLNKQQTEKVSAEFSVQLLAQ